MPGRSLEYLVNLVRELCKLPKECEWAEFKESYANPEDIGEYLSSLSNSAALHGKSAAYLVWGVHNDSHELVGTKFSPSTTKIGNEELENWLLRLLSPKIDFHFYPVTVDGKSIVLLEIPAAVRSPVQFSGVDFIRVGSYRKKLKDFPEKERALWRALDQSHFETGVAIERLTRDEVLGLLDYPTYFELLNLPLPESPDGIVSALYDDRLIARCDAGGWNITNLGGILFAKKLEDFKSLERKAMRVIVYRNDDRYITLKEQLGGKGYASGFKGLLEYINGLLPSNEVIEQAFRKTVPMYPELAVRELVANALIHQDFFVTGAGPTVEIFSNRMEITNPGIPLVSTARFLDTAPRSRNETLASLMRRFGICEERGSGVDKVVFETEFYQLPAPIFEVAGQAATRAVLFAHQPLSKMDRDARVRACYLHACLKYVKRDYLTNSSVRERFRIEPQNIASASRIIRDAVEDGLILAHDETAAPKMRKYVPFWVRENAVTDAT